MSNHKQTLQLVKQTIDQICDDHEYHNHAVTKDNLKQLLKKYVPAKSQRDAVYQMIKHDALKHLYHDDEVLKLLQNKIKALAQSPIDNQHLYPFNEISRLSNAGDYLAISRNDKYYYRFDPNDMVDFNPYDYLTYSDLQNMFAILRLK